MNERPTRVGCICTMAELYRARRPDTVLGYYELWRKRLTDALPTGYESHFPGCVCTAREYAAAVTECERSGCSVLLIVPMAYTPAGAAVEALGSARLPIVIFSTARDETLPVDMSADHLLANQMMHGVQDLTNTLRRRNIPFLCAAGHLANRLTRDNLERVLRSARAASVLRCGRIGQVGGFFEGMLDFTFDDENRRSHLPFEQVEITPKELGEEADLVDSARVEEYFASETFRGFSVREDLSEHELSVAARHAIALRALADRQSLDGIGLNFRSLIDAGLETLPFLGASDLLAEGIGYAGEGDVLTAALVASCARLSGASTFTELFCPDYGRGELLLSHMGECNYRMAGSAQVRLVPKQFAWGDIVRPAVPVFQLEPGTVTLASLSERPVSSGAPAGFQLVCTSGEIIGVSDRAQLEVPYSYFRPRVELPEFLERYSAVGGTHHLALCRGEVLEELEMISRMLGAEFIGL